MLRLTLRLIHQERLLLGNQHQMVLFQNMQVIVELLKDKKQIILVSIKMVFKSLWQEMTIML